MTVAQLKSSMDIEELAHWMAYDQIDPIGGYRQDINFAMLANVSAKIAGVKIPSYLIIWSLTLTQWMKTSVSAVSKLSK